jgi:transcriptional regulator
MHELIRAYPLATLVTLDEEGLCANHIPLVLSEKPEPYGLLSGQATPDNKHTVISKLHIKFEVLFYSENATD